MGVVGIEELKPGMILASDIKTVNGRLILPKGLTLEAKHIEYLKSWGISRVAISGSSSSNSSTKIKISQEDLSKLENYLSPFYACNDFSKPFVKAMYYLALTRLAKKLNQGWKIPDEDTFIPVDDGSYEDLFFKGEGDFKTLVQKEVELISFPDIYFKIVEAINSPKSSADYIANVVSKDPSLSAKLLRLVNSPFYGLSQKVETISRAVAIVGADELSTLALGISAMSVFKDIPEKLIDVRSFWLHSISVGVIAKLLAQRSNLEPEKFFVAGLLHDIGRLVLFRQLPRLATEALIYSYSNLVPLVDAEREVIGFDHALVGASLIQAWKLPKTLGEAIKLHHYPGPYKKLEEGLIHLADFMAIGLHVAEKGSVVLPQLNQSIFNFINISKDELKSLVNRASTEIEEITRIFLH
ncbi:MAG: Metal dependent phosphohydrolase [Desulfonauticus sp. 38_4375]|jgi:putative nucleotidyltransferase with HDIG domain|nr:MAG: Metal dependent phosphohydrolase [Desulfonauticus sp. 38_4375]